MVVLVLVCSVQSAKCVCTLNKESFMCVYVCIYTAQNNIGATLHRLSSVKWPISFFV